MMSSSVRQNRSDAWLCSALQRVARGARGIIINNHVQNAQQIRSQVHALAPFFEFIGYDELKQRIHSTPGQKPFCLMTFDDGAAINALETAPELLRLGVPAVFYIVTGAMDGKGAFWFARLAALRLVAKPGELPSLTAFKAMPWRHRDQELDRLCNAYGVDADLSDPATRGMLWDEAVRLQSEGFEIGSHTVDHAILTVESEDEAKRQIVESIETMAQHGLRPCRTFAFPNGNARRPLVEMALQAGLESTVTTVPTWLKKRDTLSSLPRLYLKERATEFYIHAKLLAARTGSVLKNPNGEGRRYGFGAQ